jgi:hypothetical protein
VVDVSGNGFNLTDLMNGVQFDLNNDSSRERLSWTSLNSDDSWLSLDRNGNGLIDSGSELFGNYTEQPSSPSPNGFIALKVYDSPSKGGNNDGWLDSNDAVFSNLRLWRDINHNGVSDSDELRSLTDVGVARIDLDYRTSGRVDRNGNRFRYRAKIYDSNGNQLGRWAWDVFLSVQR